MLGRNDYDRRDDGRSDRHSLDVLQFCADQMSPRKLEFQIIISSCYSRIDITNIPSMRVTTYKLSNFFLDYQN